METHYILSIRECSDQTLLGGKGFNLHKLHNGGILIPNTFCVTTQAFRDFIRVNDLDNSILSILKQDRNSLLQKSLQVRKAVLKATVPQKLHIELNNIKYFNRKWAVRSSADLEDLPNYSFAGLYESYLNVFGLDDLLCAIKNCWASLWTERAIAYREKNGLDQQSNAMAVLLQEMVEAKYSGVMFTRDIMSGDRDGMVIEYCQGVGEHYVSGHANPFRCFLNKKNDKLQHLENISQHKLEDSEIKRLALLGSEVEDVFGCSQDVEWTFDGRDFFILQSRQISSEKGREIELTQIWTRANVGEVLPHVISPLTWSIFQATLLNQPEEALNHSWEEESEEEAGKSVDVMRGRVYIQLKIFLDAYCYLPYVTPEIMYNVLGVKIPQNTTLYERPKGFKVRLAQAFFFLNAIVLSPLVSRWGQTMATPSIIESGDEVEEAIQWTARCFRTHLKFTGYAIAAYALLKNILRQGIAGEVDEVMTCLLKGAVDYQTAAQGRSLWEIAQFVKKNQALRAAVEVVEPWDDLKRKSQNMPAGIQFMRMIETFLETNGARAAGEFELLIPRWREDPSFLLAIIKQLLTSDCRKVEFDNSEVGNKHLNIVIHQVENSLRNPLRRWIFRRVLNSYRIFSAQRENLKYKLMEGFYLLRKIYLKIGKDLQGRGLIKSEGDIFFMKSGEIQSLIQGTTFNKMDELIKARKERHDVWESEEAPEVILKRGYGLKIGTEQVLNGIGCCAGIAEGPARVILNMSGRDPLSPGEILVTRFTDPGWTPLFLTCKGVVTEIGGFLSHGAIVAREYGIPCVVNVPGVTEIVHSGDLIRVDGSRGKMTILKKQGIDL